MYSNLESTTQIKGASLKARLELVEAEHGADFLSQVLATLSEEDQAVFRLGLLPSTWYPLELNGRLDEAIAEAISPDDPRRVFRLLGRASAEQNLQSFHRIFLRGEGPHTVLGNFPSVRRTYYSDGKASYHHQGECEGILRVEEAKGHTRSDCESTAGYFERAIELMGGRQARVDLRHCREVGSPHCEFHCRWR